MPASRRSTYMPQALLFIAISCYTTAPVPCSSTLPLGECTPCSLLDRRRDYMATRSRTRYPQKDCLVTLYGHYSALSLSRHRRRDWSYIYFSDASYTERSSCRLGQVRTYLPPAVAVIAWVSSNTRRCDSRGSGIDKLNQRAQNNLPCLHYHS